jgi:hypothetical protein
MDLDTMKSKLSSYPMLPAYERDINLIVENCTQYALPDQHTIPLCPIRHSTMHLFAIAHCHDRFSACCVPCSYILFKVAVINRAQPAHTRTRAHCRCSTSARAQPLCSNTSCVSHNHSSHIHRCSSCGGFFFSCVFLSFEIS